MSGLCAVAVGAFAAHGIDSPKPAEWLRTGSMYQMHHALAVLAALGMRRAGVRSMGAVAALFLLGTALFSGSLYAMAFGAPHSLGAVTPVGGAAFLLGWAIMSWRALTLRPAPVVKA